jgi:hypothetical protein
MKFNVLLLLFWALGGPFLRAESPESKNSLRFRTLAIGEAPSGWFFRLGEQDLPLDVVADARSEFQTRPDSASLSFYKLQKTGEETMRLPQETVSLVGAGQTPLVVFLPDSQRASGYRVQAWADDLKTFPPGAFRVVNLSGQKLGCRVAGETLVVEKEQVGILTARPPEGQRAVIFQVFGETNGRDNLIYSSNWAWKPRVRTLVVARPPEPPNPMPLLLRLPEEVSVLESISNPP